MANYYVACMEGNRQNVFEVYNKIGDWFAENRPQGLIEKYYLDKVIELIPARGNILDVGCGTGIPIMNYFLDNDFTVTGLDASEKMLNIAKSNFPEADLVLSDMRKLNLSKKYDALIAWHSFFHLPAADQPDMFVKFGEHLNPGGILLFTSGSENGEAWGVNGGENLFHASLDTEEYEKLLKKHHFKILIHKINDPGCGNATVWLVQYIPQ